MGTGLAGGVLAYALARQRGTRVAYAERIQGISGFGRGFRLAPTERVLIVADVIVTGGSVQEMMALVEQAGATVAGVGVLIDRTGGALDFGVRTESLAKVALAAYSPKDCPLCRQHLPLRRPKYGRI